MRTTLRRTKRLAAISLCLATAFAPMGSAPGAGISSDNVTHVGTIPLEAGTVTGARQVGKTLFVGGTRGFSIYDVSDAKAPKFLSTTLSGPRFPNEDVDTNGKILLLSNQDTPVATGLEVWDVRDRKDPTLLGRLQALKDHTFSCVLDCKWAYGSRGAIVDLRDPTAPNLAGSWGDSPLSDGFDVTEVAPGLILTSTRVIRLLDARKDPANPKTIAVGGTSDNRLIHSNRWPRNGKDRFFLVQGETPLKPRCDRAAGAFMTWDASDHRKTRSFRMIDEFRVTNGTYADGNPPASVWGCTAMWFQHHPTFRNGGLVVSGFFEHGTRFLEVDRRGMISEVGYFMPAGGSTIATYWISDTVVYAFDLHRGLDILEYTGSL